MEDNLYGTTDITAFFFPKYQYDKRVCVLQIHEAKSNEGQVEKGGFAARAQAAAAKNEKKQ